MYCFIFRTISQSSMRIVVIMGRGKREKYLSVCAVERQMPSFAGPHVPFDHLPFFVALAKKV